MAQRVKLDIGINIKHSASRRRSQTNNCHWKTTGNRQEFQVSENKRVPSNSSVCNKSRQASSSSGKQIHKREEKEAGRYAKQNDT